MDLFIAHLMMWKVASISENKQESNMKYTTLKPQSFSKPNLKSDTLTLRFIKIDSWGLAYIQGRGSSKGYAYWGSLEAITDTA